MIPRSINIANPHDKPDPGDRYDSTQRFLFCFGAYGDTYVLAYGRHLEDALEAAAEWLAEHASGLIMPIYGEEHMDLIKEACEEAGLPWPIPEDADQDPYYQIEEVASADLTYTESGYIPSYEWGICIENPTNQELIAFAHGE